MFVGCPLSGVKRTLAKSAVNQFFAVRVLDKIPNLPMICKGVRHFPLSQVIENKIRRSASDSENLGSNPSPPANEINKLATALLRVRQFSKLTPRI